MSFLVNLPSSLITQIRKHTTMIMSSAEEKISKIESLYKTIRERLKALVGSYGYDQVNYKQKLHGKDEFTDELFKNMMTFQRNLELLVEDAKELKDDKTEFYVKRCFKELASVRFYLEDSDWGAYKALDLKDGEKASNAFYKLRSNMYAVFQDVRVIYTLRIYPIEEKLELKSALTDLTFTNVVACLEEAETNLVEKKPDHLKDALCRCREALEKFVTNALEKEGKKPSKQFNVDIGTVAGMGMLRREEKRMIEATYSYLAEGCHGRIENLTLGKVNYAMKDTYMRIDLLLKTYREYVSSKK